MMDCGEWVCLFIVHFSVILWLYQNRWWLSDDITDISFTLSWNRTHSIRSNLDATSVRWYGCLCLEILTDHNEKTWYSEQTCFQCFVLVPQHRNILTQNFMHWTAPIPFLFTCLSDESNPLKFFPIYCDPMTRVGITENEVIRQPAFTKYLSIAHAPWSCE